LMVASSSSGAPAVARQEYIKSDARRLFGARSAAAALLIPRVSPVGINTSTSVAPATRTNSINCVRSMGHRYGKSTSTAGKELRRVGSAFFGNF
jgi:hypothetical protein